MQEGTSNECDETLDLMLLRMKARGVTYIDEKIQTIRTYLKRNSKK